MLLRPARPADARAVAQVHVRSWQAGYRGIIPDAILDSLDPAERARRYRFDGGPRDPLTVLAEEAATATEPGVVTGFVTTGPSADADTPGAGEVLGLYVDPAWWGRRIGRTLLEAARHELMRAGHGDAVLWVLAGNVHAERFYAADGWASDGAARRRRVWGVAVDELRYRRPLT